MPQKKLDDKDYIELLNIANQRLRHHHDSLWKEETHYTWFTYVIVGALIAVLVALTQTDFNNLAIGTSLFVSSIFLSFSGITISFFGYYVIRREGEYFHEAIQIRNRLIRQIEISEENLYPTNDHKKTTWETVNKNANKKFADLFTAVCLQLKRQFGCKVIIKDRHRLSVRDIFQITILIPVLFYLIAIGFSIWIYISFLDQI